MTDGESAVSLQDCPVLSLISALICMISRLDAPHARGISGFSCKSPYWSVNYFLLFFDQLDHRKNDKGNLSPIITSVLIF